MKRQIEDEKGVRKMYGEIERLRRQGRKEGRIEAKRNGAANLLALGKLTVEEIAQVFDLNPDEVRALANRAKA